MAHGIGVWIVALAPSEVEMVQVQRVGGGEPRPQLAAERSAEVPVLPLNGRAAAPVRRRPVSGAAARVIELWHVVQAAVHCEPAPVSELVELP